MFDVNISVQSHFSIYDEVRIKRQQARKEQIQPIFKKL